MSKAMHTAPRGRLDDHIRDPASRGQTPLPKLREGSFAISMLVTGWQSSRAWFYEREGIEGSDPELLDRGRSAIGRPRGHQERRHTSLAYRKSPRKPSHLPSVRVIAMRYHDRGDRSRELSWDGPARPWPKLITLAIVVYRADHHSKRINKAPKRAKMTITKLFVLPKLPLFKFDAFRWQHAQAALQN